MGYEFRPGDSAIVNGFWRAESHEDGSFTDAANEFWGLAFDAMPDGPPHARLVGPSVEPRTMHTRAGEVSWGVEFTAAVFLRRVSKPSLLGELRDLPVDTGWFELGGVRFPIPSFDHLDGLVDALRGQGVIAFDPLVAAALAGEHVPYSERQLRRRTTRSTGVGPSRLSQLARARTAYRLLTEGTPIADAAVAAGFSDQAHMTRAMRQLAGMTPARILGDESPFASRPAR